MIEWIMGLLIFWLFWYEVARPSEWRQWKKGDSEVCPVYPEDRHDSC